ncbi:hypothetical protein BJV74DRAFT_366792 [Russula compacta]|nr:hypothetical protein BJV74DRAFT_366792 [Russula compacta]
MPSWSTGPGIRWDEPSDTSSPLWSNAHHATQDWSIENTYGDIPLGNSCPAELPADDDPTVERVVEPESHPSSPSSPRAQSDDIAPTSLSRDLDREVSPSPIPSSPPSPEPSPPSSPDVFGTFTVGTEPSDTSPFAPIGGSMGGQLDDNEWGSPWKCVSKDVDGGGAQHASDEWESAKLRQIEMDRRVPPELLSRILVHLGELTNDAWPETQNVVEEDWQKRWNSGMDIDGLDSLLLRYTPALTLPQLLPSRKSFTAKAMTDSVKLSRNTALARISPMSTFLATKGSTAWETSVKSRTETSVDEVPLGWRILEKDEKKSEKAEERVKKSVGLLAGLWSRRASSSPSNPPSQEQVTPSSNATAPEGAHPIQAQSQRSSMESVKSSIGTLPASQAIPQPTHARAPSQDEDTHASPPGSAVSRFLQRFSRPRRLSSSSPRDSLALSSGDLEYLSDVRSNSADPVHPVDELIAGLGSATESTENGTLHGKLPPPLPPPPNVSLSLSHNLAAPARGSTLNGNTLISPDNPHTNAITDLQIPTGKPTTSTSTPFSLSPFDIPDSPKSVSPNSALSHPLSSDKITPSLDVSLLPVSSLRTSAAISAPPVAQLQLRIASGHTAQSFPQDDDDFSDFSSSPANPPLLPFNVSSPSSSQGKVASSQSPEHQLNSPFDDLVHLMSSPTTGPLNTKEPDAPQPFSFAKPALPTAPSPPTPRESTPTYRASLDFPDASPTHSRSHSHGPTSPPKVTPASPKQKAIAQGHQRTQSLLDLAASRKGRWPAPPSPLPEPIHPPPPPPTGRGQGEGVMNADYFGTTPTDDSFTLSPPPPPPGKTSLLPSLVDSTSPQVGPSKKDAPTFFDAIAQRPSSSGPPSFNLPASPSGLSARRALSPPPLPAAIMNTSPSSKPSLRAPVPLLPPPSGYRLAAPPPARPSPSPAQFSPESTPLALLIDSDKGKKNINVPAVKATPPPPPVKGTGGLTAQDLSFFEGL